MRATLAALLLPSLAGAVQLGGPVKVPPAALNASLRGALALTAGPAALPVDPKLTLLLARLDALQAPALPAPALSTPAAPEPEAALPRTPAEAYRALAAVSEALQALDLEQLRQMPESRLAETASRLWEGLAPVPVTDEAVAKAAA